MFPGCLKQSGKLQNRNKRELTCKKGFRQHSSNQESNKPVANTHWRKILIFQFLSVNYWSKEPYTLILTGVKASQPPEQQGKKRLPSPLKGHSNPEEWHISQLRLSQQKNHRQGGLKSRNVFSHSLGGWTPAPRAPAQAAPVASRRSPSHCALTRREKQASSLVPLRSTRVLSDQVPPLMT